MFFSLTGELAYTDNNSAAVDVGGVAYLCYVSYNTLKELGPIGSKVTLYTYLKVAEDVMDLYGFFDKEELDAFKLLISVSGVGPKAGLAILSEMTPSQLYLAIASGDAKSMTAAQGIGPKVAQRVCLELKDKVGKLGGATGGATFTAAVTASTGKGDAPKAIAALVGLGYSQSEAAIAVGNCDQSLPVDQLIKQALKQLSR